MENGGPFISPLSSDNLIHTLLKTIQASIAENKREFDVKFDKLSGDVADIRSTVDRLGVDHIFSDIKKLETEQTNQDKRLTRVEDYHNRILGVVAVAGFMLAVSAVAVNFFKGG